jgi:4-amino-4-deoxy-L-arabinose transferase-like glycosyltransferase
MPDGLSRIEIHPPATQHRAADAAAVLCLVLAAFLLRLTSFVPAVVDADEGLFMVQAREWLAGGWPLVAAWDMHPVGAPALYALAFAAFGVSMEAARLLGSLCVAATAVALYGCARVVGAPRAVGLAAGVIYAAYSVLLGGLSTTTELLLAPFVTGAMAVALHGAMRAMAPAPEAPGWGALVVAGLTIGLALVVKQVVVPEGSLVFAVLVGPALLRGVLPWRRALAMAAAYAVLCATPFLLVGLAYWSRGWLAEYLDGSLLAPFRYSLDRIEAAEAWRRITGGALRLALPLGAAGVALALWRPWRGGALARLTGFAALWFAVATLAIAAPGFFFEHYFLLWLPALSLLAAIGVNHAAQALARPGAARAVTALLVALIALPAWLSEASVRIERGPGLVHRDPAREVAAAVAAAAGPDGDAFMANYAPNIYVLSGARIATRFVFPPHLTGRFEKLSDTDTVAELARVLAARPRVIVVARGWMDSMRPSAAAQVMATVEAHYERVASIEESRGAIEVYRVK